MTTAAQVDDFKEHRLWATLDETLEFAQQSNPRDATSRHTVARGIATLQYLRQYRHIDPHLFPVNWTTTADNINAQVTAMLNALAGWDQSVAMPPNTTQQVDQYCSQIMGALRDSAWPVLFKEGRAAAIASAAEAFRTASERSLAHLTTEVDDASRGLADVRSKVQTLEARAEGADARMAAAAEAIEAQLEALRATVQEVVEEARSSLAEAAAADREALQKRAVTLLDGLSDDAQRGKDLVALVGDQATGGGYFKFAQDELQAYRLWNGIGIAVTIAAALYLFIAVFIAQEVKTLNLQAVITRSALSLPLLAIAGYSLRQAGRRQRQSVEARYRALDVLAVEPFTNNMTADQQSELRLVLGQRLFGAGPEASKHENSTETPLPSVAQLQPLLDLLKLIRS